MITTALVFKIMELIGTAAFAISGALVGINKNVDIFGVIVLGVVTALGGGAMRDVIIGNIPPAMFTDYLYITVAIASTLIVFLVARINRISYFENAKIVNRVNNVFDAIGLGAFTITGISMTAGCGYAGNVVLMLIMGMITGAGGGMLRDLLVREIPFILNKQIYAVASLVGGICYYLMSYWGIDENICIFAGVLIVFIIRMVSTVFKWNLPRVFDEESISIE